MAFVVVLGDAHIPDRASDIPPEFKKMLIPGRIQHILSTGNLTSRDTYDYLRHLSSDVHVVKGDFDDNPAFPDTKVVSIGEFQVGLVHGHDVIPWGDHEALAMVQRKLDVDILVSGHTHEFEAWEYEDKLFINPGSVTGAFSPTTESVTPSFALMDFQDSVVTVYVYFLVEGQVKVDKFRYTKGGTGRGDGAFETNIEDDGSEYETGSESGSDGDDDGEDSGSGSGSESGPEDEAED